MEDKQNEENVDSNKELEESPKIEVWAEIEENSDHGEGECKYFLLICATKWTIQLAIKKIERKLLILNQSRLLRTTLMLW